MSIYTHKCIQTLTYLVLSTLSSPYICKHGVYKEDVYVYMCVYTHTQMFSLFKASGLTLGLWIRNPAGGREIASFVFGVLYPPFPQLLFQR